MKYSTNPTVKLIKYFLIIVFSILLASCGGGSSSTTNDDKHYPGELFPEVDETALINNPPSTLVRTVSNDAEITVVPTSLPKIDVTETDIIDESNDNSSITLATSQVIDDNNIGQLLFVDGVFKGVITDIDKDNGDFILSLENAEQFTDVYDSFDITFRNDAFRKSAVQAMSRAIKQQKIGRYDHLNTEPLSISVIEKPVLTKSNNQTSDEVVLRIDIPEGYYVPIQPRELECSFTDADCTLTVTTETTKKIVLEKEYKQAGLTFSTKGSYVEIGLGSYLKARYDKNLLSQDFFEFELAQSAHFESNMVASVSGELSRNWSTTLDLLFDFEVEITHPYSLVAKTSVVISPNIVFGVEGKIKGTISATSQVKRAGEIRFKYNSLGNLNTSVNNVKYTPKDLNKDAVDVSIEAEGHAYIMPALTMLPSLKFLRINIPVTFVFIRSGIKLDNELKGKISTNFIVENDGALEQSYGTEASFTTSLYGLIQSRWFVRAAGIDFHHTANYSDLFKTGALNILEWKAQLINPPTVETKDIFGDETTKELSFNIKADKTIAPHLHFYYTIGDKDNLPDDIAIANIENHKPVWKSGDDPITIDNNSIIKVRAVLYNKDISKTIWAWGTSVSQQKEFDIVDIMKPEVSPDSQSFESSLSITITQSQGFDVFYKLNDDAPKQYFSAFDISEDTTLIAYASDTFNGRKVQSETVTRTYYKCDETETLEDGICVLKDNIVVEICDDGIDNNNDGQIDEGCSDGIVDEAEKFGVFFLFPSQNSIWVGKESDLIGRASGSFSYGGLCRDATECPLEYSFNDGPFTTIEEAEQAFCAAYIRSFYSLGVSRLEMTYGFFSNNRTPNCDQVGGASP